MRVKQNPLLTLLTAQSSFISSMRFSLTGACWCPAQEYGQKLAVKELSLQLREGQLTSLLGHNGAGENGLSVNAAQTTPLTAAAVVPVCLCLCTVRQVR